MRGKAYWFVPARAAWIIHSYTSPQHAVICWTCVSLTGSCEDSKALLFPRGVGGWGWGGNYRGKKGGNREVGTWRYWDWSDSVSGEELLRSDYLGRTKCFCWWRVALISGSWGIDETHRALAHWSWPRHWQSMAWLAMRENEAKWATRESVSLPLLRVVDAALLLGSFVLTSSALEWLIITCSKVWALCVFASMHVRVTGTVESFMLICMFRFFSIPPPPLIPFKNRNKTLKKKKEKNKQKMKNTAFFFGAVFNA